MYQDAFDIFPELDTDRLYLRRHRLEDAEPIEEYLDDPDIKRFYDGFIPAGHALDAIRAWCGEAYESKSFIRWCIARKEDNLCIGGIYLLFPYGDDTAGRRMDIGYELSPRYRNRGYMTEAIKGVVQYGFRVMGIKRIQAQILPGNIASIRACEKAGFLYEGLLRNFCHYQYNGQCLRDMVMMSCILDDIGG